MSTDVLVEFWGTRGSIPTPGRQTRVYGGNTPCVEIRWGSARFICDAGSGIRPLGRDLLSRRQEPETLHLFISHTHWDHIQGFPFFAPAYVLGKSIILWEPASEPEKRYKVLSGQMSSDYFPVNFGDLNARFERRVLAPEGTEIEGVLVQAFPLNHPGGAFGYRFSDSKRSVLYATDNELSGPLSQQAPGAGLRPLPRDLLKVAQDADLLIADAQYADSVMEYRKGWGHSSWEATLEWAVQSRVKTLALFHHDPECSDAELDVRVTTAREAAARHAFRVEVMAARERVTLKV